MTIALAIVKCLMNAQAVSRRTSMADFDMPVVTRRVIETARQMKFHGFSCSSSVEPRLINGTSGLYLAISARPNPNSSWGNTSQQSVSWT
jgi:hypothetical protein